MKTCATILMAAILGAAPLGHGQDLAATSLPDAPNAQPAAPNPPPPAATASRLPAPPPTTPEWQAKLNAWLALDSFQYASRYRSVFAEEGSRSFDQGQQKLVANGRVKFDQRGRCALGFGLSSGRYFNWSYADFIGGGQHQFVAQAEAKMNPTQLYVMSFPNLPGFFDSGGGQLYLRQFFLAAEPLHGVEVQFGGLGIRRGVNTEATSYDDDGYLSGERLTLKRPHELWLSEASFTRGFLGDFYTPNFFARGERLAVSNYWQILARKDFGQRLAVSADYTWNAPFVDANARSLGAQRYSLKTTREAVFARIPESKVVDSVRFEAYQRLNGGTYLGPFNFSAGKGYAVTAARDFRKHFSLEAGVARIDLGYTSNIGPEAQALILGLTVNGDQYGVGQRYFLRPAIPLNSWVSATGVYSRVFDFPTTPAAVGPTSSLVDIWNRQYLSAGLNFDLKKAIFKTNPVK